MVIEVTILISNLLLTAVIVIGTIYRIYIERRQIDVVIKNAKYAEKMKVLRRTIERERENILNMSGKDVLELLEEVCKNED